MTNWQVVPEDDRVVPGWAAWEIHVRLATMPDGSVATVGLRIQPRDDYDGTIRDQRITLQRLRRFPIGFVTAEAKYLAVKDIFPEVPSDDQTAEEFWSQSAAEIAQVVLRASPEEREALLLHMEALEAQVDAWKIHADEARIAADAEVRRLYLEAGWSDRDIKLVMAADYYREALRDPHAESPRRYVAEKLGVSLTTVDRLLREARASGRLEPYDGAQGKHGKKEGGYEGHSEKYVVTEVSTRE